MKYLLISSVFPPEVGGSGRWFWEIYRRLARDEVVIAAGKHAGDEAFDRTHDLNVARLPLAMGGCGLASWSGLSGYMRNYHHLSQLVRRQHVTQIHCGRMLPEGCLGWALRRRFGIPYVCYVHGEESSYIRTSRELTWMAGKALRSARLVIANSENTFQMLRRDWQLPEEQIRVLHPGVDVERFVPGARDAAVRQRLGWDERPVVLTVGRLQTRKGQDHLIQALPQVRQSVPNVLYSIVGDGLQRPRLEKLVRELNLENHVQFRGESSETELIDCYQQCDLFALPNRDVNGDYEGFGMVLLEAQACGRPALAGASGGTAEAISAGKTGWLVRCDEPEPLAQALAEILHDPDQLERMGQTARNWVKNEFDWPILTARAKGIFKSLSGSRDQNNSQQAAERSRDGIGIDSESRPSPIEESENAASIEAVRV